MVTHVHAILWSNIPGKPDDEPQMRTSDSWTCNMTLTHSTVLGVKNTVILKENVTMRAGTQLQLMNAGDLQIVRVLGQTFRYNF